MLPLGARGGVADTPEGAVLCVGFLSELLMRPWIVRSVCWPT